MWITEDAQDYSKEKVAIFQRYNINEEMYRQRFHTAKLKKNETLVELVICV